MYEPAEPIPKLHRRSWKGLGAFQTLRCNTLAPFFQVFDPEFLSILGPDPFIREIASTESYKFAHEAPIWSPQTDEIFFASNAGADGKSGPDHNNAVYKIKLTEAKKALVETPFGPVKVKVTKVVMSDEVQMTNGVDPKTGHIYFTDVPYGFYQDFRLAPTSPNQVYRFDTKTHAVRVVADDFDKPNGLTPDGKTVYITDTGAQAVSHYDGTHPATIYAFDLDPLTDAFINRRVFAYADTGVPDGIQINLKGDVYSGCDDGVHVWNNRGTLLGKFFIGSVSPQMAFVGPGQTIVLAETKVFWVQLADSTKGQNLDVSIPYL